MSKKKRQQMQKGGFNTPSKPRPAQREPAAAFEAHPEPTEAQEAEHRAWIERQGHEYISLAEAARQWGRSPEQLLRWERLLEGRPADG